MAVGGDAHAVRDVRHFEVLDEFDASLKGDVVLLGFSDGQPFRQCGSLAEIIDLYLVWIGHLHFQHCKKVH